MALLRRFYKLVHPDYFEAHPVARAANEVAMMQLNQWLDVPTNPTSLHLVFYLREPSLRRLECQLAPGTPKRSALVQLLTVCSDESVVLQGMDDENNNHNNHNSNNDLMSFLQQYSSNARERLLQHNALDREEALWRHLLARERVGVGFVEAVSVSKKQRVVAVELVAAFVDGAKVCVIACVKSNVVICSSSKLLVIVSIIVKFACCDCVHYTPFTRLRGSSR
jgi:hypothetical protein